MIKDSRIYLEYGGNEGLKEALAINMMHCNEAMQRYDFHLGSSIVVLQWESEGEAYHPDMCTEEIWEEYVHALREKVLGTATRQSGKPSSAPSAMDEDPPHRKRPSPGGQKGGSKRHRIGGDPDDDDGDDGDDDEDKDRGGPKGSLPMSRMPKNVEAVTRILSSNSPT